MAKLAVALVAMGTLAGAGTFFYLGLQFATNSEGDLDSSIRAVFLGLGAIFLVLGVSATWLAVRAGKR
jgi:hypothetical protein